MALPQLASMQQQQIQPQARKPRTVMSLGGPASSSPATSTAAASLYNSSPAANRIGAQNPYAPMESLDPASIAATRSSNRGARAYARERANQTQTPQYVQFDGPMMPVGANGQMQPMRPDAFQDGVPMFGATAGPAPGNSPERVMPSTTEEFGFDRFGNKRADLGFAAAREAAAQRRQNEISRKASARELITKRAQQSAMERRARLAQRATGAVMNLEGQMLQAAMQGNPAAVQMLGMIANNRNALADRELRRLQIEKQFELDKQRVGIAQGDLDLRKKAATGEAGVRDAQAKNIQAQTDAMNLESGNAAAEQAMSRAAEVSNMSDAEAARYVSAASGSGKNGVADDMKRAGVSRESLLSRLSRLNRESAEYKTFVKALKEMGVTDQEIEEAGYRRSWGEFMAGEPKPGATQADVPLVPMMPQVPYAGMPGGSPADIPVRSSDPNEDLLIPSEMMPRVPMLPFDMFRRPRLGA